MSVLASWMNRICAAGIPAVGQPGADLPVHLGTGRRAGSAEVAEDDLETAAGRGRIVTWQHQAAVGVVDAGHVGNDGADLARASGRDADEVQIEGGLAAVAADLEHVVLVRVNLPHTVRPFREAGHVGAQLRGGADDDVVVACRRALHRERLGWAQVGDLAEQGEQFGDVLELGGAAFHPETGPVRGHLNAGLEFDKCCGPGVGAVQSELFKALGVEVVLEHVHLQQRVGHGCPGEQRRGPTAPFAQQAQLHVEVCGPFGRRD